MRRLVVLVAMACGGRADEPQAPSDPVTPWTPPACPAGALATEGPPVVDGPSEVSGLGALGDGLVAHDDSGSPPGLWVTGPLGASPRWLPSVGVWVDPEDLAIGPGPDGAPAVWVGDIGNNARIRQTVTLWAFPVDQIEAGALDAPVTVTATWDGVSPDAESLLIDPLTSQALVIAKAVDDATVYAVDLTGGALAPVAVARTPDGEPLPITTGAALSPGGGWVAVRSYTQLWLWPKDPAAPVVTAFDETPCELEMVSQRQGETITFLDDRTLATWSEGGEEPVWTIAW